MASTDTLPHDVVERCTKQAKRDGIFAGVTTGLFGGIIGSKWFRFSRNTALVSGAVTGILVGHQLTQAFLATNIARAKAEKAQAIAKAKELETKGSDGTI